VSVNVKRVALLLMQLESRSPNDPLLSDADAEEVLHELRSCSEDALTRLSLHPSLLAALDAGTEASLAALLTPVNSYAVSLPILHPNTGAALAAELRATMEHTTRLSLTHQSPCSAASRVAAVLSQVLPKLVQAAGTVVKITGGASALHLSRPSRSAPDSSRRLCSARRSYAVRYRVGVMADSGRVHRCHVDDSDVTLATCLGGGKGGRWTGADLNYVETSRPGTPDPNYPCTVVRQHVHTACVGVLHGGNAYHYVSPLLEGERMTIVTQAMVEDGSEWKRSFLQGK
jgi:hypothetical protein